MKEYKANNELIEMAIRLHDITNQISNYMEDVNTDDGIEELEEAEAKIQDIIVKLIGEDVIQRALNDRLEEEK